ncbi:hypothetical protein IT402_02375 [Candidatus Nomurabacteria bacterium]|nr:hypothetical protein [Candidatus Nomurabacteria bacterium]
MYIVTTLDKDLYDQARVSGKIASIITISKFCTPEIRAKVEKSFTEMDHISSRFDLMKDQTGNTRDIQNCLQTLNNLSDWLLHQISNCPAAGFLQEELHLLLSLAEQRMIILREK